MPALALRGAQFMPWLRVGAVLSKWKKPLTLVTFFSFLFPFLLSFSL